MIVQDGLFGLLNAKITYLSTCTWKLYPTNTVIGVSTNLAALGAEAAWAGYAAVPAPTWSSPTWNVGGSFQITTNTDLPTFSNTSGAGQTFYVIALVDTAASKLVVAVNIGPVTIPNGGSVTYAPQVTDKSI